MVEKKTEKKVKVPKPADKAAPEKKAKKVAEKKAPEKKAEDAAAKAKKKTKPAKRPFSRFVHVFSEWFL